MTGINNRRQELRKREMEHARKWKDIDYSNTEQRREMEREQGKLLDELQALQYQCPHPFEQLLVCKVNEEGTHFFCRDCSANLTKLWS